MTVPRYDAGEDVIIDIRESIARGTWKVPD